MRKDFAEIQNAILEKYGYIDRVDHRSLKAQRESALLDGDEFLANLLDRIPEQHISESVISPNHPEVINIKRYRNFKREYQDLLFKTELLQHKINESKIADIAKKNDNKLPEILLSDEFEKSEIDSDVLAELKNNLVSAIKDVQAWKNTLVSKAQAKEKAMLGFMPPENREIWQQYKAMCKKRDEWIHLNERLNKPNDYQTDALAAYNELKPTLEDKILKVNQEISALTPVILQIKKNLNRPHMIQKIQSHTAKVMFNNRHAYTQYRKANEHLHNSLEALEQVLFENQLNTTNPTQKVFTTMEIYNHLRRRFSGLIKEQKRLSVVRDKLSQKVFTLNRANKLAENLYVNGAFKILRTKNHELDKAEKAWQENKLKLDLAIDAFNKTSTPKFWQSNLKKQHENKKAHLTENLNVLMQQKDTFKSLRQSLDEEHNKLIIQCSTPEAKQKIAEIAAGIIQKNQKTAIQLEEIISKSKEINHKINNLKNQIQTVKERLKNEKGSVKYKLRTSIPQGKYDAVKIIANAMAGSSKDAQLVAQLKNNTAMDKDWDMMTDDEKAEVMRKKTLRDI